MLADALFHEGRRDDAIAAVRAAIAEEPDVASHRLNLATLLGGSRAEAKRWNPWVDDARILAAGARPSVFVQQDALVG